MKNILIILIVFVSTTSFAGDCLYQEKLVKEKMADVTQDQMFIMFTEGAKARCKVMDEEIKKGTMKQEACLTSGISNYNGIKIQTCKWIK